MNFCLRISFYITWYDTVLTHLQKNGDGHLPYTKWIIAQNNLQNHNMLRRKSRNKWLWLWVRQAFSDTNPEVQVRNKITELIKFRNCWVCLKTSHVVVGNICRPYIWSDLNPEHINYNSLIKKTNNAVKNRQNTCTDVFRRRYREGARLTHENSKHQSL